MKVLLTSHRGRQFRYLRAAVAWQAAAAFCVALVFGGAMSPPALAQDVDVESLKKLSLEDLANLEVSIASRTPQRVQDTAAAVFVITREDIRRSGARTIADALRMVPGLEVANIDSNQWAVSARGFNGRLANKLLVLIDGRTVYSPTFSGVYWSIQDTYMDDIERIEIIRGPGATVWGANAVNGVINVITRHAADTQGPELVGSVGTEERGLGGRYGGVLGDAGYYRGYAQAEFHDAAKFPGGGDATDDWRDARAGFRVDLEPKDVDHFTVQGDIFDHIAGKRISLPDLTNIATVGDIDRKQRGFNVIGRWEHQHADASDSRAQFYVDYLRHTDAAFGNRQYTLDLDLQHSRAVGRRHVLSFGFGYRYLHDEIDNTFVSTFDPDHRNDQLFSAFLQDDIDLFDGRALLTLGSKVEHNDFTGFEVQPNARLLWRVREGHAVWGSVARAVRTPSAAGQTATFNQAVLPGTPLTGGLPTVVRIQGNRDYESEYLTAFELGYRGQISDRLSLDVATFYNDYDNLQTFTPTGLPTLELQPPPPHLVQLLPVDNNATAEVYGVELASDWRPLDWWRLQLAYSWLEMQVHGPGQTDNAEGESPEQQLSLRSSMDLGRDVELDFWPWYVDKLPALAVSDYLSLYARIAWRPVKDLELSLIGRNLLTPHHLEFRPTDVSSLPTEVQRAVVFQVRWRP